MKALRLSTPKFDLFVTKIGDTVHFLNPTDERVTICGVKSEPGTDHCFGDQCVRCFCVVFPEVYVDFMRSRNKVPSA